MSNKHTPGPWVIEYLDWAQKGYVFISAEDHGALAQVVWLMEDDELMGRNSPENEANAHLIAAAPELLEALQSFAKVMDESCDYPDTSGELQRLCEAANEARAAIAKATGGAA